MTLIAQSSPLWVALFLSSCAVGIVNGAGLMIHMKGQENKSKPLQVAFSMNQRLLFADQLFRIPFSALLIEIAIDHDVLFEIETTPRIDQSKIVNRIDEVTVFVTFTKIINPDLKTSYLMEETLVNDLFEFIRDNRSVGRLPTGFEHQLLPDIAVFRTS